MPLLLSDDGSNDCAGQTTTTTSPAAEHNDDSAATLREIQRAVQGCQRCIIITGAGISVSSGIPDFRSPDGLFQQLKQKYPNSVSNGKDLFDATLFGDAGMISVFYNFMGELRTLVSQANCTPTHMFIKELDECGKLLRCYTQNIDSLEKRIGLETSFQKPASATHSASGKARGSQEECLSEGNSSNLQLSERNSSATGGTPANTSLDAQPGERAETRSQTKLKKQQQKLAPKRRRQTTLDKTFTKAVQLHGDLDNVVCTICHTRYPFTEKLVEEFCEGAPPPCPRCKETEIIRDLVGKRAVASGVLRPDIVLYNEAHPQSEVIGALSEFDLKRRPDLLIVIGTSLKIPGIKRMVKEMSRCVRSCSLKAKRAGAGKTIFINRDEPARGWEDVFDFYVSGDSDQAISLLPIKAADSAATDQDTPHYGESSSVDDIDDVEVKRTLSNIMSISSICSPPTTLKAETKLSKALAAAVTKQKKQHKNKAASGLVRGSAGTKQSRTTHKLTAMLKVVKATSVSESKRSRLPRKIMQPQPQPQIEQVAIPKSPLAHLA
ncbi:DHS-like NAD/FAD-binding domain-containing protein [Kickxella alabastrina]|uniref:DHS-like NAD/FAD-binding domain-containing protein n=1 Tax=Kickxella alabastrina TaxID=61397 RepID=UPI0022206787|nr:DHS-like NAD/FAD-binding domain-containing protein [Kickxella alabastrina]KAI7834794.1 DHS-like NAD/FAD-binding domain-containing protein [Kickxella alabastrina]